MAYRNLKLLDAAEQAADEVNKLIDRGRKRPLLHAAQLRKAAQSVSANIREGLGRDQGPDRDRSFKISRAEANEVIGHLRPNFKDNRIERSEYWPLHNKYVVIVKMVDSICGER